jgi:hypothetical protein
MEASQSDISYTNRKRYGIGNIIVLFKISMISFVVLSGIVPVTITFPLRRFILGKMPNPSRFKLIEATGTDA